MDTSKRSWREFEEYGFKFLAIILLKYVKDGGIAIATEEEMRGIHLLERDGELEQYLKP